MTSSSMSGAACCCGACIAAYAEPTACAGGSCLPGLEDDGPEDLTTDDGPEPQAERIAPPDPEDDQIRQFLAAFDWLPGVSCAEAPLIC